MGHYAEIITEYKKDFTDDLAVKFKTVFGEEENRQDVIDETIHKDSSNIIINSIVYAHMDTSVVWFVERVGPKTLRIHIERRRKGHAIKDLKSSIKVFRKALISFVKRISNKVLSFIAHIYIESNREFKITYCGWTKRFLVSLKKNLLIKIYIPAATVIASLSVPGSVAQTTTTPEKAIFNLIVAFTALLVWILIEPLFQEPYECLEV